MSIRIAGFAFLILSAVYYSYVLIKNEKRKLNQLEDICSLILYTKNQIDAFMTPIDEIVSSYRGYSEAFTEYMKTAKEHGLSYASENCNLLIGKEADRLFRDFSHKIGCGYKDEEVNLCQYTHAQLSEILQKEREENRKKSKMYKTLPVMSAISIALMLN